MTPQLSGSCGPQGMMQTEAPCRCYWLLKNAQKNKRTVIPDLPSSERCFLDSFGLFKQIEGRNVPVAGAST